jgi:phosphoribosylanthranilate isomerase
MQRTRIKICGITRAADAAVADACGADAIGMILHADSARRIDLPTARAILQSLGPFLTPVGVFVDAEPAFVIDAARSLGLRHVQLHGSEPPEHVAALRDFRVIKALRVSDSTAEELRLWQHESTQLRLHNLTAFLLESGAGGSGVESEWTAIAALRHRRDLARMHLIAAGGLRPDNVARVVAQVRPWAVDVSTGVEDSIGVKSPQKTADFVAAVREADAGLKSKI